MIEAEYVVYKEADGTFIVRVPSFEAIFNDDNETSTWLRGRAPEGHGPHRLHVEYTEPRRGPDPAFGLLPESHITITWTKD